MVFGFGKGTRAPQHREIGPVELRDLIAAGKALVVDVREADEFVAGHVPGAINLPLSRFDASHIPESGGRTVVLNCLGGKRSRMALDQCESAQAVVNTHLAGGFGAWTAAGLPVER